jgi:asparagine synthase (glutamine-hydrolysing)
VLNGIYIRDKNSVQNDAVVNSIKNSFQLNELINGVLFNSTTAINNTHQPYFCKNKEAGLSIQGIIDLYNKAELEQYLGLNGMCDAEIALELYRRMGKNCVTQMQGEFSFAIWDEKERILFCARDQMGFIPLFYFSDGGIFAFSNIIQNISSFPFANELREMWIIDFLQFSNSFTDETVFEKIHKLPPAHTMIVSEKYFVIEQYWNLEEHSAPTVKTMEDAVDQLRYHLEKAVHLHLSGGKNIGIELSGGIDSGGIAAIAQPFLTKTGRGLTAFSNVLPDAYKTRYHNFEDEWDKANDTASHLKINRHIPVDSMLEDTFTMLQKTVDMLGYPVNYFMPLYQESTFYKAKKNGVSVILTGFGGNEVVTEHANVIYVNLLAKGGRGSALMQLFESRGDAALKAIAKAGYHIARGRLTNERMKMVKSFDKLWNKLLLNPTLLNDKKVKKHYNHAFGGFSSSSLKERIIYRITHPRLSERLEVGKLFAGLHDIKYRHPLLHVPLIEYYYSVPDKFKVIDARDRILFRKVIETLLPYEIVYQSKRGIKATAAVPFYKVESELSFDPMRDWLLSLSTNHKIFDYVSRDKIENFANITGEYENSLFKGAVIMALFLDKIGR